MQSRAHAPTGSPAALDSAFATLTLWATRSRLPGRWRLYNRLAKRPQASAYWRSQPLRWTRSCVHGLLIPCDMRTFSGQLAWFFNRWYELDTQSVILSLLREGDIFVDVGANVGMASLTAARAIGPSGRIVAFEPNPDVAAIFREAIARNDLGGVIDLRTTALSDEPGRLDMFVPESNHGEASLAADFHDRPGRHVTVDVADASALDGVGPVRLIKIDVEGFEHHVLRALTAIIERDRPFIITEVVSQHLERAGTSPRAVAALMETLGYQGARYEARRSGLLRKKADLLPFDPDAEHQDANVLWIPRTSEADPTALSFTPILK